MLKGSGTRKLGGRDSLRAFQRFLGWSLVALFVSLVPSRAHAYTWMIKHGYASCPVCHADPSGGELLTTYGRVQSDELLRMKYGKSQRKLAHRAESAAARAKHARLEDRRALWRRRRSQGYGRSKAGGVRARKPPPRTEEAAPTEVASTEASSSNPGDFLWGLVKTPDWLLLGGSYRHLMVIRPTLGGQEVFDLPDDGRSVRATAARQFQDRGQPRRGARRRRFSVRPRSTAHHQSGRSVEPALAHALARL